MEGASGKGDTAPARIVVSKERGNREEVPRLLSLLLSSLLSMPPLGTWPEDRGHVRPGDTVCKGQPTGYRKGWRKEQGRWGLTRVVNTESVSQPAD